MEPNRIILIGKGIGILQAVHDALSAQGHEVSFFHIGSDADIQNIQEFAGQKVDLVALGAALSPEQRNAVRQAFERISPGVQFFQGSAPIAPMIVEQITAVLQGKKQLPTLPQYVATTRTLTVMLPEFTEMTVTLYWITSQVNITSDSCVLYEGSATAGAQQFTVPDSAATHWSFATIVTPLYFSLVPLAPRG